MARYQQWIEAKKITHPNDWIFFQEDDRTKPKWDSGFRRRLSSPQRKRAATFPASACTHSGRQQYHGAG